MRVEITGNTAWDLADYARVSIAFEVDRVLEVSCRTSPVEFRLRERALATPYTKNYDERPENRPSEWANRFDLSRWTLFSVTHDGERIGGAAVIVDSPEIDMLEGRTDLALLWDLRVVPAHRRSGCGSALFDAAEAWARARGCTELEVETQNVNVPACRFYERKGCRLQVVSARAYAECPDELQLLWFKSLRVW
jgi:GNAT superfamily N-acetyltransferase